MASEVTEHRPSTLAGYGLAVGLVAFVSLSCGAEANSAGDAGVIAADARVLADADLCADQVENVELIHEPGPDLLLVVDRSVSMSGSRWTTMTTALDDLVTTYNLRVRFGLQLFPSDDGCATALAAPISDDNTAEIISALNGAPPGSGGTPMAPALEQALDMYQSMPINPNGRHVLVATDGEPTCLDTSGDNAIAAVSALAAAGIPTHVLGYSYTASLEFLNDMATAGGTGAYHLADNLTQLKASFDLVAGALSVPACAYELERQPEDDYLIRVFFDNVAVARSAAGTEGWDYDAANNEVEFSGAACDALESGSVMQLRVEFGCAGPIID